MPWYLMFQQLKVRLQCLAAVGPKEQALSEAVARMDCPQSLFDQHFPRSLLLRRLRT